MSHRSGRHFLQIPGPTNVPDRVLRALAAPTIDHRGPEFASLARTVLDGLKPVFRTTGPVVAFPASGTGAWEAALVNTLSPGDRVLCVRYRPLRRPLVPDGGGLGLDVESRAGELAARGRPRAGPRAARERPRARDQGGHGRPQRDLDRGDQRRPGVRAAVDAAGHPALLLVDTVSSLASIDYRHDEWGVDVTVSCSQKGLMLPPGLGFNAHR